MIPKSLLLAFLAAPAALLADVSPAPLFTDRAVLQRDKPVPVWGTADAGETVTVTFQGQTKSTTAGADGRWRVTLDPLPASARPASLTLTGKNKIILNDILVGEVWIASGQSNMEWTVVKAHDHALEIPGSANPLIRHIKIKRTVADAPATTVGIDRDTWETASPTTTGEFSAIAYFFARDIQAVLGVPVGLINSTWGGTRAEAWTDPATLTTPAFAYVAEDWAQRLADYPSNKIKYEADLATYETRKASAAAAGQPFAEPKPQPPSGPGHQSTPSGLYNAMIAPLVPYALRGTLWYQGESNIRKHAKYHELFSALITGWRTNFGQGDFPFYWVQLANYASDGLPDGTEWAFLREAQARTLALPATGQAVTIDLGNVNDIHPGNKKDVGRRLARLALARDYGFASIPDRGPVLASATREGAAYRLAFSHAAGGLIAPLNELSGFELADADQVFHPAEARLTGQDAVLVSSPAVPEPAAVRYAWRNAPKAGLFNKEGLPAEPFRTDAW